MTFNHSSSTFLVLSVALSLSLHLEHPGKTPADDDIKSRLRLFTFSEAACRAAVLGQSIPRALGLPVTRLCIIRGIRYNHNFGEELRGILPEFTRVLNARNIMSDNVPLMTEEVEFPYCIWHPQAATEATNRELVRRSPNMAYLVGRACAVAGYFDLYKGLAFPPEVHIAEEARDAGILVVFDDIMAKPIRYAVIYPDHLSITQSWSLSQRRHSSLFIFSYKTRSPLCRRL